MSATRLFIGNLPYHLTNDELDVVLSDAGHKASEVSVVKDRETGQGRGFGFAEFGSTAAAEAAKGTLQGLMVHGRPLRVDYATSNSRPSSGPRSSSPPPPRHDDWGGGGGDRDRGGGGKKGGHRSGRDRDRGSRW